VEQNSRQVLFSLTGRAFRVQITDLDSTLIGGARLNRDSVTWMIPVIAHAEQPGGEPAGL
jgi:hypothetical protein